ncbi:MAG: serine/threonine-protein kinase, partial [Rhodospirillales bacterium]
MSKVNIAVGDLIRQRFVLEKELGRGGMGRVFKALDRIRQEAQDREPYVAIKILDESLQNQPIFFMGMQREAKKAQKLNHPNIVRVYDFDRDGPHIFLVMEYLAGKSLDDVIAQGKSANLSLGKILFIIRSVAAALEFAHKHGIVHLDLKPKNVFLTDEGQVKVIDFGIARAIKNPKVPADDKTVFDPRTLGALSPSYASPQMIDGVDPDARDDIFSLGCVAYELIAGRHPFDRVPATRARAEGREPVRPAGLSNRQWAGLKRALSFDRKMRTSSIANFIADLSAGERSLPRAPLLIAAGVLGILLLAGGGYLLWPSHEEPATLAASSRVAPDSSTDVAPPVKGESAGPIPLPPTPAPVSPPPRADMAAVMRVLSDVPCARLRAVDRDGAVAIQGYSGDAESFSRALASLSAQWRVPFKADQVGSLDRQ